MSSYSSQFAALREKMRISNQSDSDSPVATHAATHLHPKRTNDPPSPNRIEITSPKGTQVINLPTSATNLTVSRHTILSARSRAKASSSKLKKPSNSVNSSRLSRWEQRYMTASTAVDTPSSQPVKHKNRFHDAAEKIFNETQNSTISQDNSLTKVTIASSNKFLPNHHDAPPITMDTSQAEILRLVTLNEKLKSKLQEYEKQHEINTTAAETEVARLNHEISSLKRESGRKLQHSTQQIAGLNTKIQQFERELSELKADKARHLADLNRLEKDNRALDTACAKYKQESIQLKKALADTERNWSERANEAAEHIAALVEETRKAREDARFATISLVRYEEFLYNAREHYLGTLLKRMWVRFRQGVAVSRSLREKEVYLSEQRELKLVRDCFERWKVNFEVENRLGRLQRQFRLKTVFNTFLTNITQLSTEDPARWRQAAVLAGAMAKVQHRASGGDSSIWEKKREILLKYGELSIMHVNRVKRDLMHAWHQLVLLREKERVADAFYKENTLRKVVLAFQRELLLYVPNDYDRAYERDLIEKEHILADRIRELWLNRAFDALLDNRVQRRVSRAAKARYEKNLLRLVFCKMKQYKDSVVSYRNSILEGCEVLHLVLLRLVFNKLKSGFIKKEEDNRYSYQTVVTSPEGVVQSKIRIISPLRNSNYLIKDRTTVITNSLNMSQNRQSLVHSVPRLRLEERLDHPPSSPFKVLNHGSPSKSPDNNNNAALKLLSGDAEGTSERAFEVVDGEVSTVNSVMIAASPVASPAVNSALFSKKKKSPIYSRRFDDDDDKRLDESLRSRLISLHSRVVAAIGNSQMSREEEEGLRFSAHEDVRPVSSNGGSTRYYLNEGIGVGGRSSGSLYSRVGRPATSSSATVLHNEVDRLRRARNRFSDILLKLDESISLSRDQY